MKVIIADDESLIRSSLKSMLGELDVPVQVVGEAKNGEELVELAEKHSPDLIFADIRMPRLSGLQAIKIVKDKVPHIHWVMLTGFADFEYAREALRLGALNYLLKPVTPEDIGSCVTDVYHKHLAECMALSRDFEREVVSVINETRSEDDLDTNRFFEQFRCTATVFYIDSYLEESEKMRLRRHLIGTLQKITVDLMTTRSVLFAIATLSSGSLAVFTAWYPDPDAGAAPILEAFDSLIGADADLSREGEFSVTALQTEPCADMNALVEQIQALQRLSPLRTVIPGAALLHYPALARYGERGELLELCGHLEALCRFFAEKDYVNYSKELGLLEKSRADTLFRNADTLRAAGDFLRNAINCSVGGQPDRVEWFACLQSHGEKMLAARAGEERMQGDLIQIVINYVNRNYMNDIGIGQIAGEINVTPNYLSSLFHKKYGITFMKFLTETRMLKAKELLLTHPAMKIRHIAEEVGYYSTRHFTKLFTEYFGSYPSELRMKKLQ